MGNIFKKLDRLLLILISSAGLTLEVQAASFPDTLTNTASASLPPGWVDTNGDSGDDSKVDSSVDLTRDYDVGLNVTKDDGTSTYVPGGSTTYTIVVTNTGKTSAEEITVTDSLPTGLTIKTAVSCQANGSASCGSLTAGTGEVGGTSFEYTKARVTSDPDGSKGNKLTITLEVNYASDLTGTVINQAQAVDVESDPQGTDPAIGVDGDPDGDGTGDGNTATPKSDLAIVKTVVGNQTDYTPGDIASYQLVVSNDGPSDVTGALVKDTLPEGVTLSAAWSCEATDASDTTSSCPATGGTAGDEDVSLSANIANGKSVTVTIPVIFSQDAVDYQATP